MLHAEKRDKTKKAKQYRKEKKIPAIVYGHGFDSIPIALEYSEFEKSITTRGEGGLIDLKIGDEKSVKVVLQDYQVDPVKQTYLHIDFYRIRMDEKLHTQIPLTFIGESPAIRAGGVLIKNRDLLDVECLPGDLISEIEIDLSRLIEIPSTLKVSDIEVPKAIDVLDDPDTVIVNIIAPQKEEEVVEEDEKQAEKEAIEELEKDTEEEQAPKDAEETKEK